jgi:hypothetical protein
LDFAQAQPSAVVVHRQQPERLERSDSASSVLIAAHRLLLRIWRALLLN